MVGVFFDSATEWAKTRNETHDVRLGSLEAYALQGNRDLIRSLSSDGASLAAVLDERERPLASRALGWVWGLVMLILVAIPILGAIIPSDAGAVFGGGERVPASTAIPLASIAFWVTVAALVVSAAVWAVTGARFSQTLLGCGFVAAVAAAFAMWTIGVAAEADGYSAGQAALPVWLTIGLGIVVVIAVAMRRAHFAPHEAAATAEGKSSAIAAIRKLSAPDRERILADRNDALLVLKDAGFIDERRYLDARAAELGTLSQFDGLYRGDRES